jgi:hypothetical protein
MRHRRNVGALAAFDVEVPRVIYGSREPVSKVKWADRILCLLIGSIHGIFIIPHLSM